MRLKTQWTSINSDQERRFAIWRERKDLIGELLQAASLF